MQVMRFASGGDFLERAQDFLLTHEVENCLPLGISNQLRLYPDRVVHPPYLATVENGGEVLAAAVMTPPMGLVLAATESRDAIVALAADVVSFNRATPGVSGSGPAAQWFAEQWQTQTGDAIRQTMAERVYALTRVSKPVGVPGDARRASASDRELLIEWFTYVPVCDAAEFKFAPAIA